MSRADVERSLKAERRSEHRSRLFAGASAMYVTAELTLVGAALINEVSNHHNIGINSNAAEFLLWTGLPAVYGIVRSTLNNRSHANTAAALEGVLAQDQLNIPAPPTSEVPN